MSVSSATVGRPAATATSTSARASARASSISLMKAPLPCLTSMTRPPSPAASFLDRIEETISGIASTLPVASRMAYNLRSAGARSSVWPPMTQPTSRTTLPISAASGVAL